jgi:hypothetical protein
MADPTSLTAWSKLQIAALAMAAELESSTLSEGVSGAIAALPMADSEVTRLVDTHGGLDVSDYSFEGLTLRDVAALPPTEILARYLERATPMGFWRASSRWPEVIGEIAEGQDGAHVLYRWDGVGSPSGLGNVEVVPFRRIADQWRFVCASTIGPPLALFKPGTPGSWQ